MAGSSNSSCAAKVTGWPSSISATSSLLSKRGASNLPTRVVISSPVVDDKEAARHALREAGLAQLEGPFLDFHDPWGNRVEIVDYENIQFTKAPNVLRGMGLDHLTKNESAKQQLTDKGMGGTDPFRGSQK